MKKHFLGQEKSWILGKMAEIMEKSWNFIFGQNIRAVSKLETLDPCHQAKICPKKPGFLAILVMENLN